MEQQTPIPPKSRMKPREGQKRAIFRSHPWFGRGGGGALVVQTLDSAIQRIKIHPLDSAIGFPNTYPLDSDLSSGYSAIQRLNNRGLKNKSYLLLCLQRFLFLMQSLFCSLPNFPHPSPLPHPAIGGMIVWRFGLFAINKKIPERTCRLLFAKNFRIVAARQTRF